MTEVLLCEGRFELKTHGGSWEPRFLQLFECEEDGERMLRLDIDLPTLETHATAEKISVLPIERFHETPEWIKRGAKTSWKGRKNRFDLVIKSAGRAAPQRKELSAEDQTTYTEWKRWFPKHKGGSAEPVQLAAAKEAKREEARQAEEAKKHAERRREAAAAKAAREAQQAQREQEERAEAQLREQSGGGTASDGNGSSGDEQDETHHGAVTKVGRATEAVTAPPTPQPQPVQDRLEVLASQQAAPPPKGGADLTLNPPNPEVDLKKFKKQVHHFEKHFDHETVQFLKSKFELADGDNNGWFDFDELRLFFESIGQSHSKVDLRQLIDRSDDDNNGRTDFGELLEMLLLDPEEGNGKRAQFACMAQSKDPKTWFQKAVGKKSVDFLQVKFNEIPHEETLNFEELHALFSEIGQSHDKEELRELSRRYDAIAGKAGRGGGAGLDDVTVEVADLEDALTNQAPPEPADFERLLRLLLMEPGHCAMVRKASNEYWAKKGEQFLVTKCWNCTVGFVRPLLSRTVFAVVFTAACILWAVVMDAKIDAPNPAATAPAATTTPANATISFPIALLQRHCGAVPDDLHSAFASPSTLVFAAFAAIIVAELVKMLDDFKGVGRKLGKDYLACAVKGLRKYAARKGRAAQVPERLMNKAELLVEHLGNWVENDGQAKLSIMASDLQSVLEEIVDTLNDPGFESWEELVCWRDDGKGIVCGCTLCCTLCGEGGSDDAEDGASEEDGEDASADFRQAAQAQIAEKDAEIRTLEMKWNRSKQDSKLLAQEAEDEMMRRERISFAAVYFIICVMVFVDQVPGIFSSISGVAGRSWFQSIPCTVSKTLLVPLYKPLTFPMWGVLLTVLKFVHWERARHVTPKETVVYGKLRAGRRPVNRNWVLDIVVFGVAIMLGAWCAAALFVLPVFVGFAPVSLVYIGILPTLLMGVPLFLISRLRYCFAERFFDHMREVTAKLTNPKDKSVSKQGKMPLPGTPGGHASPQKQKQGSSRRMPLGTEAEAGAEKKRKEFEDEQAELGKAEAEKLKRWVNVMVSQNGELLLKVGMVLCFTSGIFLAWFADLFYGNATESWARTMNVIWPKVPSLSLELVWEISLTFAWPSDLSWNGQFTIIATIGVAAAQYLLQLFRWLDLRDKYKPAEDKPDRLTLHVMRTFYRTHDPSRSPEKIQKEWHDHRFDPEHLVAQMIKKYGESPVNDVRKTSGATGACSVCSMCTRGMRAAISNIARAMRKIAHSFLNAMGQWALEPFEFTATGRLRSTYTATARAAKEKISGRAKEDDDTHKDGEKVLARARGGRKYQAGKIFAHERRPATQTDAAMVLYSVRFADGSLDFEVPVANIKSQKLDTEDPIEVLDLASRRKKWMPAKIKSVKQVGGENQYEVQLDNGEAKTTVPLDQISKRRLRDLRDDLVIEYAANNGSEVRYIDLEGCRNVSDHALRALARSCDKLEEIDLLSATGVSGSGILELVTACSEMSLDRVSVPRPTTEEKNAANLLDANIKRELNLPPLCDCMTGQSCGECTSPMTNQCECVECKDLGKEVMTNQSKMCKNKTVCLKLLRWLDDKPAVDALDLRGLGAVPPSMVKLLATNLPGLRRGEFKIDQIKEEWPARRAALFYDDGDGGAAHQKLHSRASLQAPPGDETRKLPLDLWVSSIAQDIDRKVGKVKEMGPDAPRGALTAALDAIGELRGSLIKATLDGSLNKHLTDPDGANGVSNAQVAAECCLWKARRDVTNVVSELSDETQHTGTIEKDNEDGTYQVSFEHLVDSRDYAVPAHDLKLTENPKSRAKLRKHTKVNVSKVSAVRAHQIARLVYMDAAVPLRKEGKWDDVEKVYTTALAEDPDNSWARDTLRFIEVARDPGLADGPELKAEVESLKLYTLTGKEPLTRTMLFHAQTEVEVGRKGSTLQLKKCSHGYS